MKLKDYLGIALVAVLAIAAMKVLFPPPRPLPAYRPPNASETYLRLLEADRGRYRADTAEEDWHRLKTGFDLRRIERKLDAR